MKRFLVVTPVVLAFLCLQPHTNIAAQTRMHYSIVSADSGHVALGLAIRKLNVSGTFMQSAAHPDDEHNALFALFTLGHGLRSVDVQTNRGEGGQNEIGPELFRDIGVLRTSELLSAHRIDGAEQYFTRAIDYGYSFDPQEVIRKWGQREIIGDFVRLIRTLRPDVMLTMNIQGRGGDRAHEATTILATEAYREAGDPTKYPEQIAEGLRAWQPKKLYYTSGFGGGADNADKNWTVVDTGAYDPLLGRTYAEIGADARSNHKCQGVGGLPSIPGLASGRGGRGSRYELIESTIPGQMQKDEQSMFDGIDTTLAGIARFAGATPPQALTAGLATIAQQAERAQQAFAAGNDAGTAQPIEAGLAAVRTLRSQLGTLGLDEAARYEIDYRLKIKERDFEDALLAAHGLTFEAIADDGLIIDGQPVKLSLVAINRGGTDVQVTGVDVAGFDGGAACAPGTAAKAGVYTCSVDARVPQQAPLTQPYYTDDYWAHPSNPARNTFAAGVPFGVPFAPSPFHVTFHVKAGSAEVVRDLPVQYRYVKDIYKGDKRMELAVVPALSVRMTPELAIVPAAGSKGSPRELHVTVTNGTKGPANATVTLDLPAGWKASPSSAPIAFTGEDESLSARFTVTPPSNPAPGEYPVGAVVTSSATGTARFTSGYQTIEYPHVERRQVIDAARTRVKVVDVRTVPGLNVGYIVGVGDQVPPAIEQLGAKLTFIDTDELAWGDLSKYDVIVTGVRAYERRADLRAYNRRLLDYAANGGTVIVQYCKMEFNDAQYGPYPAKVSRDRVSDETVPVKVLVPDHPVFNTPNKIDQATWDGWVQERGLYFLGEKDAKYTDLVSMVDSFPDNPGVKLGSLVEARTGKGRWLYVGLALWRQLPAGTDGAYQLFANLLALGNHGGHRSTGSGH
jgi:LmbE family N-acetylglucosaminyl deacetylase